MYGIGNTDDWEQFFESTSRQESPQVTQGLLGSVGEQDRALDEVIYGGKNKAAQLGQSAQPINPAAGNELLAQRQISTQELAQQDQQNAQSKNLLMQLAKLFFV